MWLEIFKRQKSQIHQAIQPSMPQRHKQKTCMSSSGPTLWKHQAVEKPKKWEKWFWMTCSPTGIWPWFFCLKYQRMFCCLWARQIYCLNRELLWGYHVWHIGNQRIFQECRQWSTAFSCMIWSGCSTRLNPQLIGFNICSNGSTFCWLWLIRDATKMSQKMAFVVWFRMIVVQWIPFVQCGTTVNQSPC